jgi:hypothetical protein
MRPYFKKIHHTKKGLVEWLKVKALSSSPSTGKKKKKKRIQRCHYLYLPQEEFKIPMSTLAPSLLSMFNTFI